MRKHNRVAIYFSNQALTGFNSFKFGWTSTINYNDVLRPFYDALYRMNAEMDFVDPSTTDLSPYKLILVPALYAASDAEIERLNAFAKAGGHLLYTFKSGFSDEQVRVRSSTQPGLIAEAAGVHYNQFTIPNGVSLENDPYHVGAADNTARWWMELLTPTTAITVARTTIQSGANTRLLYATTMAKARSPTSASCPAMGSWRRLWKNVSNVLISGDRSRHCTFRRSCAAGR
jgi:beta-galactosidase